MSIRFGSAIMAMVAYAAFTLLPAAAQERPGEEFIILAAEPVDLSASSFTIDVSKAPGAFRGIRVRAKAGSFDLSRVQIRYGDGRTHSEDRRIDMRPGERSRAIDYTSRDRFIDRIIITQKPGRGRGIVQVIGIQSAEGARMKRDTGRPVPPPPALTAVPTKPTSSQPITVAPGTQTESGEVMFGAQSVGFGVDRDVIRVGAQIGKFDRIRFRIIDNAIFVNEVKVVYETGDPLTLTVDAEVPKNSRTSWLKVDGRRFIKEVQMIYRSKPSFDGQARVEVLGDYAAGWLGPGGEGRKFNQGWVLLGAQSAGFIGFDKDTIPVGRNEGGFRKVRVVVKDRAITLNELKVLYESGGEDVIPVRTRVDAGGIYGPVELTGGKRAIKEIVAKYRSRFFDSGATGRGMAIVEIWGQH